MIGGEREDVLVAPDPLVELIDQFADDFVETQQDVLDLMAPGAEIMADDVERREAHREKVGRGALPQLHAVDGVRRQPAQRRVGIGTFLPRAIEKSRRLAVALLQGVWHLELPLGRRLLAQRFVVELVV